MRFLNENYLRAFPREEKSAQQIQQPTKQIVKDEPGDVLATDDEPTTDTHDEDPDLTDPEVIDDGA